MATIAENRRRWESEWNSSGDEWSEDWGGPEAQWFGSIYPRVHAFLPGRTVLEIAPGHGRWTQYLKNYCERLIVVDLTEHCIERCRVRFSSHSLIEYHVNDGKSLPMIADGSIDFLFSFDSLVHADADVLRAYLVDLARKLTPEGVGFIHHSNLGEYVDPRAGTLPEGFQNLHWRSTDVTAAQFESYCEEVGLGCVSQEIVNWGGDEYIDCFSTFTRRGSRWMRQNRLLRNGEFMEEARCIKRISHLYADLMKVTTSTAQMHADLGY